MKFSNPLRSIAVSKLWSGLALLFLCTATAVDAYSQEKQYLYFENSGNWNDVMVYAWDDSQQWVQGWPGQAMSTTDTDGILYWEYTGNLNIKNVIIHHNNGEERAGRNEENYEGNLAFENGMTYRVDGTTYQGSYSQPEPNPNPGPDPTDKQYVYFNNTDNWSRVYIYVWGDGNKFLTAWPGEEMRTTSTPGVYYWDYDGPLAIKNVIFHNNQGTKAGNGDLVYVNGKTYDANGNYSQGDDPTPNPGPSDNAGAVLSVERHDDTLVVNCENATLYITPYSEHVVKVFTLPNGSTEQERRSITVSATPDVDFTYSEDNDYFVTLRISNGDIVAINKADGLISFYDHESNLKLAEKKYLNNSDSHSVKFESMQDVAFYGGGYHKWGSIKDRTLRLNNTQTGNWSMNYLEYPHNICIPFVVSTSNYGVLFDDHYINAEINPASSGLSYKSEAKNPISYYYIGGENPDEVIANYTSLTGRASLPPYWSLGYITSRYGYHSETEANQVINNIRGIDIPLDGLVFDLYWEGEDESGMGNLDWHYANFPNPTKMLSDWKADGIHTILITEPYFTDRCNNWQTLRDRGFLADEHVSDNQGMSWLRPNRDVGLLDCSNPDALDWMYTFYKARTEEGIDGWWLDLGEPEGYDFDSHHAGGTPEQVKNEFGQLWLGHINDCLQRDFPDMRRILMPRAGTSGMQRHSAYPWTGDIARSWEGLQVQIPSLTNMSMSGVSTIGSDVGGFIANGYTNAELYLRWVQFAAFSPMMRTHSQTLPEPYNDVYRDVRDNVRKAINLRYRMLPYLYTLSFENVAYGYPMARPAGIYDTSTALASNNDSYLWGRDIFVAPMVNSGSSRSIQFPQGTWLDMNDVLNGNPQPNTYLGGTTVSYSAPLEKIPFFLRRGAFFPMFTAEQGFKNTADLNYGELNVYHYISEESGSHESILYIDDRTSASAIENANYELVHFTEYAYDQDGSSGHAIDILPEIPAGSVFSAQDRIYHMYIYGCGSQTGRKIYLKLTPNSNANQPLETLNLQTRAAEIDEATGAQIHDLTLSTSLEEARNATDHAAYYDEEKNMLYLKANVPANHNSNVFLGSIPTSVSELYATTNLTLSFTDGYLNYSVGDKYREAVIDIYSADGTLLASVAADNCDSHVHSVKTPSVNGFCIARITARDAQGNKATQTCKFMNK